MTKYRNENYNRETDDWYQTFEMVAQLNWEDFQIYINENNESFLKKCVEIVLKGKTKFRGKTYTDVDTFIKTLWENMKGEFILSWEAYEDKKDN